MTRGGAGLALTARLSHGPAKGSRRDAVKKLLDPAYWARALRNPLVLLGLAVDLIPVYAVLVWGWTAAPLVMLYWLENVVAGVMTLPRILLSGAAFGWRGVLMAIFFGGFFTFHYGLFCFVHGIFLQVFMMMSPGWQERQLGNAAFMDDPVGLIGGALSAGPNMVWVVAAGVALQVVLLVWQFGVKGEWKTTNPMSEMFAPYPRIVVLHFGIFVGAGALFLLGEPMIGVLGLIIFRALWGVLSRSGDDPFMKSADLQMTDEQKKSLESMLGGKLPDGPAREPASPEKETVRRYDA